MDRRDDQLHSGWRGRHGWLATIGRGCLIGHDAGSDRAACVFQPITLLGSALEGPQRFNTQE
jgi:hypothetical protein